VVPITHEQIIIYSKTRLDGTAHEQTIICRQLFAGHVVGCRPMEGKKILHRMIIFFLGNKNHSILCLNIVVIVCANLTSNAVIFKRIADRPQLKNFCNDYRTYIYQAFSSPSSITSVLQCIFT